MKIMVMLIAMLLAGAGSFAFQQEHTRAASTKSEVKKGAKEIASGSKEAWKGLKKGGKAVGKKTKSVAKVVGHGTRQAVKDVKKEVKK